MTEREEIYVVVRDGVYRHEIMGWRGTEVEARELAISSLRVEDDSYHAMVVVAVNWHGERQIGGYRFADAYRNPAFDRTKERADDPMSHIFLPVDRATHPIEWSDS